MTHTPGPWIAIKPCPKFPKVDEYCIHDADGYHIAEVFGVDEENTDEYNARLIAAAPDLLEACKAVVIAADRYSGWKLRQVIEKARAAIARAEGKVKYE